MRLLSRKWAGLGSYSATLQPNRRAGCTESLWPAVAGGKHNGARVGASAEVRAKVADERGERECCGVSGPGGKKKKAAVGEAIAQKVSITAAADRETRER